VVSRSQLVRHLSRKRPTPEVDRSLITAAQAVELTQGAFSLANLSDWEKQICPYLGSPLSVELCDVLQSLRITFHGQKKLVRRVRREQKHYLREEILKAYRTLQRNLKANKKGAGKKRSRGQGLYIDEDGKRWLTQAAAFRLHGCRQQALEHWRIKGWVRSDRRKRAGYGNRREIPYYAEEDIVRLRNLQRAGDGHVVMSETITQGSIALSGGRSAATMSGAATDASQRGLSVEQDDPGYSVQVKNKASAPIPVVIVADMCTERHTRSPSLNDRLQIDLASSTATLDGKRFSDLNADSLRALEALQKAQLAGKTPISKKKLREMFLLKCNHDTTLSRWIDALPKRLRDLIDGKSGTGLRLVLTPS
jgi:hypothetical protein